MRRLSYKKALRSFSLVMFWLWQKDFDKKALTYEKCLHKMLMKLTIGWVRHYFIDTLLSLLFTNNHGCGGQRY